jgi:hypothetical protein
MVASLGSNVLSQGKGPNYPTKLGPSLGNNVFSLGKGPNSLVNNHVSNCFQSQPFHVCFFYGLVTYHWKALKKDYNFVIKNTLIKIDMKKIEGHKI